MRKCPTIVLRRVRKCIVKIDYEKISPIDLPRVHKRITKIDCAKVSPIVLPRVHKHITLLVLGDFLLTLYWGGVKTPPLFFSETTRDLTIGLTPVVL